jgi:hypothetical protein
MCCVPLFWTRYYIIFVFLMVICNSLLLLKSLPINIINCIKFYVNCSALTGVSFPRFVAIRFYFLSETLILIASPIIFLFIHNHLALGKWCYTPLQHDFALDPMISSFHYHFDFLIHYCCKNHYQSM